MFCFHARFISKNRANPGLNGKERPNCAKMSQKVRHTGIFASIFYPERHECMLSLNFFLKNLKNFENMLY